MPLECFRHVGACNEGLCGGSWNRVGGNVMGFGLLNAETLRAHSFEIGTKHVSPLIIWPKYTRDRGTNVIQSDGLPKISFQIVSHIGNMQAWLMPANGLILLGSQRSTIVERKMCAEPIILTHRIQKS